MWPRETGFLTEKCNGWEKAQEVRPNERERGEPGRAPGRGLFCHLELKSPSLCVCIKDSPGVMMACVCVGKERREMTFSYPRARGENCIRSTNPGKVIHLHAEPSLVCSFYNSDT